MAAIQQEREAFWVNYYAGKSPGDNELLDQPSPFAVEIQTSLEPGCTLLEIGCGNGRDSLFFAANKTTVIATDICETAVHLAATKLPPPCRAFVASAKNLPVDLLAEYAYARFVLHALTEEEQRTLFVWLKTHISKRIFIETRSVNDPRCGKGTEVSRNAYVDTHYRRFMSSEDLTTAAAGAGLRIEHMFETSSGSGNDGAVVLRAVLSA